MQTVNIDPGTICLVFGCILRLEPGWATCRPKYCRSRPCWVAQVDLDNVLVLPFSRDTWRSPIRFNREGGLTSECALLLKPISVAIGNLGPVIGQLDPEVVYGRFIAVRNEIDDASLDLISLISYARGFSAALTRISSGQVLVA